MLDIVARVARIRPDPVAFVQALLNVGASDAEKWLAIANEEAGMPSGQVGWQGATRYGPAGLGIASYASEHDDLLIAVALATCGGRTWAGVSDRRFLECRVSGVNSPSRRHGH